MFLITNKNQTSRLLQQEFKKHVLNILTRNEMHHMVHQKKGYLGLEQLSKLSDLCNLTSKITF